MRPSQPIRQCFPSEEFHHQIRGARLFAHVIQRADVGMCQRGDDLGFAVEALAELRIGGQGLGQDLDRDRAVEPRVARFVDLAL